MRTLKIFKFFKKMRDIAIKNVILPNKPLSNFELEDAAKRLKIPVFRGVFVRNDLPKKPRKKECGILNLDDSSGPGTHWVAWFKDGKLKNYFDSYGIRPPIEIKDYLGNPILYNTDQLQRADQVFCGHLCLFVLKELTSGNEFQRVLNKLF